LTHPPGTEIDSSPGRLALKTYETIDEKVGASVVLAPFLNDWLKKQTLTEK